MIPSPLNSSAAALAFSSLLASHPCATKPRFHPQTRDAHGLPKSASTHPSAAFCPSHAQRSSRLLLQNPVPPAKHQPARTCFLPRKTSSLWLLPSSLRASATEDLHAPTPQHPTTSQCPTTLCPLRPSLPPSSSIFTQDTPYGARVPNPQVAAVLYLQTATSTSQPPPQNAAPYACPRSPSLQPSSANRLPAAAWPLCNCRVTATSNHP